MTSGWVEASGVSVFTYEWGDADGLPLLFWDGIGGTGLRANELAPVLVEDYGFRVIAPDPPGHGRTPALAPEACRPSNFAGLAADLLRSLGIERSAFLGFSWGAEIGCWFAARFPERTTRLVLVDGGYLDFADVPEFDTSLDLAGRVAHAEKGFQSDTYPDWDAYVAAEKAALGRWNPRVAEGLAATRRLDAQGRNVPILTADVRGAIDLGDCREPTASIRETLRADGVPILLVVPTHGPEESVRRQAIARFQAAVPQLRVHTLASRIHDLVSTSPREVAAAAGEWLTK